MGWGSGVYVFDKIAKDLLALEKEAGGDLGRYTFEIILESVRDALEEADWDTQSDSKYWDDPRIGEILGNDFYRWENGFEEQE